MSYKLFHPARSSNRPVARIVAALGLCLIIAASIVSTLPVQKTDAISGNEFQAGRIIDDVIFTNNNAMSVADIQNFLNAKVPNCDTQGTQASTRWNNSAGRYYTRAEWGSLQGNPAPFTCLRDYRENPTTHANNAANPFVSVPGGISAAQIIWNAAQAYKINPQVILTTLQKEQGLITDDWPWERQYDYAMGYGCPDTAGCNNAYRGFQRQVDGAAWQFRYYLEHPNAYNYWIGNYYVRYSPDASCGGRVINIQNAATAALYIYTPYQPSDAALSVVTDDSAGGSVHCGAYGNRNFWWYFNKWFGSSQAPNYSWQPISKSSYTDQTKTTGVGEWQLITGQRYYMQIKAKNTGNVTWQKGVARKQVNVGTYGDSRSPFCDATWLNSSNCARTATTIENTVAPGEIGTFEFWIKAPSQPSVRSEYFSLVMDGTAWLNDPGLYWRFTTSWPTPAWQPVSKSSYVNDAKVKGVGEWQLITGQRYYMQIKAKNTGNIPWIKGPGGRQVNIGTSAPNDRRSIFCDSTWLSPTGCTRTATMVEERVNPGNVGTFEFWIKAPSQPGVYNEYFNPVMDGVAWLNDPGLYWRFTVSWPTPTWQPVSKSSYTDQTKTTGVGEWQLKAGQRYYMQVKAKNTGNVAWQKGVPGRQVNMATSGPGDRKSIFCDSTWLSPTGCTRLVTTVEDTVEPGQVGTFEFWLKAPSTPGVYNEYFNPVMDNTAWLNDPGLYWHFTVSP